MKLKPRRRFRDRLLVAMVAVALLPLAGFAILSAVELDSISRTTASRAQGAILQDEQDRQQSTELSRAGLIDARIAAIDTELGHLSDGVSRALAAPGLTPAAPPATPYHGDLISGTITDPLSVLTGAAPAADQLRILGAVETSPGLVQAMQGLRHDYPEIESVWISSTTGVGLAVVPGFDAKGALDQDLLDPAHPLLRGGSDVFTGSERRLEHTGRGQWVAPIASGWALGQPFWTDSYPLMTSEQGGVSAWVPLKDGHTMVGVDVSAASLVTTALSQPSVSALPPAAYPLLLSSDGTVVYADAAAAKDFSTQGPLGAGGAASKDQRFTGGLRAALGTGQPAVLQAHLSGTAKDVFAAPVYGAHWVLATPVPISDLEPDLTGLTYGIAAGIHALFPVVVLPALFLLLGLAFLAATILSRRLVGPVRALTQSAEVLAAGRTDVPVPQQGADEVGVLATALERMRGEINSSRGAILAAAAELEVRVERRTTELRTRNEELVALNQLAGSLTRSLDPHVILGDAIDAIRAVHPLLAARGYVLESDSLVPAAAWFRESGAAASAAPQLDALAARALARGRRVRQRDDGRTRVGWPLVTRQGPVGALAVVTDVNPQQQTRRLLQAITDQVALALRSAMLSAAGKEHAVLEERTRLAREIHDTLAQQLTGIVLQLEAAETLVERGSDRAKTSVEIAHELARSALQEARRSVWNLRPAPLAATGVIGAIEREVRALEDRTGISATFSARAVSRHPSLQPNAEVALLRIAQEALANVARHSNAGHVDVGLRVAGEHLVLAVRDDGAGFDPSAALRQDCFGLEGMRERVQLAGGSLVVVSEPGNGTEITARVPLVEAGDVEHSA